MTKEESIYERIAQGEVFILCKDKEGLTYVGNKDGVAFIEKVYWKDTKKSFFTKVGE